AWLPVLPEHHDGDAAEALDPRPALLGAEAGLADGVRLPDEPSRPVPRRAAASAGDAAQPRCDARVATRARHDADPVPLRRRAAAQPFPDRARVRRRQAEAVAERIQAAVRGDEAVRVRDDGLGTAPRREDGTQAVR